MRYCIALLVYSGFYFCRDGNNTVWWQREQREEKTNSFRTMQDKNTKSCSVQLKLACTNYRK